MTPKIKVRRLSPLATLPNRGTAASAGLDLCAAISEPLTIYSQERKMIPTGISVEIPMGWYGDLRPRSGLATKRGIILCSSNVVDSDYRGEVGLCLLNTSGEPVTICPGDRIAQMIVTPYLQVEPVWADDLSDTARGDGGFGSTGR